MASTCPFAVHLAMSDKKSFIAYKNWKSTFDELSNEDAGKLVKHIFEYVNGNNPKSDSVLIRAVFANIKDAIDRDIEKWEKQLEQRKAAGKRSAEARKSTTVERPLTSVNERERNPTDNVNVSVTDSVSVSEKTEKSEKEFEQGKTMDSSPAGVGVGAREVTADIWPTFDDFWDAYDKKVGKEPCEKKWKKIKQKDREEIMRHVPAYVESTPEKKFRKNPQTYLNQKSWKDEEVINPNTVKNHSQFKYDHTRLKEHETYIDRIIRNRIDPRDEESVRIFVEEEDRHPTTAIIIREKFENHPELFPYVQD